MILSSVEKFWISLFNRCRGASIELTHEGSSPCVVKLSIVVAALVVAGVEEKAA